MFLSKWVICGFHVNLDFHVMMIWRNPAETFHFEVDASDTR